MREEAKFIEAYDKYGAQILRHISFRVSSQKIAEDIFQETFMKAWRNIAQGQKVDNIRAFLYTVARNLIVDHYRLKSRTDIPLEDIAQSEPVSNDLLSETSNKLETEKIKKVIREMESDEEREIIYQRYVDDLSIKEIAEMTGKTPNNIRVICHRGLKKIRDKII